MARPGITEAQVIEAAEALLREGSDVTVAAVRERIGSGSYSTINATLATWRKEHGHKQPANLPDMPPVVAGALKQVWAVAWQTTQDMIAAEREALEVMRRQMLQEQRDMEVEISRLETDALQAKAKAEDVERSLEEERSRRRVAEEAVVEFKIGMAGLREKTAAAEGRAFDLKEELDRVHAHLKKVLAARKRPEEDADEKAP